MGVKPVLGRGNIFGDIGYDNSERALHKEIEGSSAQDVIDRLSMACSGTPVHIQPKLRNRSMHFIRGTAPNPFFTSGRTPHGNRKYAIRAYITNFKQGNAYAKDKVQDKIIDPNLDIQVTEDMRAHFGNSFKTNLERMQQFLITEIGPLEMAFDTAMRQSTQALNELTEKAEVYSEDRSEINTIIRDLIRIKTIEFVCESLGIETNTRTMVLDSYLRDTKQAPGDAVMKNAIKDIVTVPHPKG